MYRLLLMLCTLLAASTGCAGGSDPASGRGQWVELRGTRFAVDIADDDESRARGLMFRDSLPDDSGMLFLHDREEPQSFWMKNTRIALDILYFDRERRLVAMAQRVPPCSGGNACPSYPSRRAAKFTLELSAGTAHRLGLNIGDELKFGPGIAAE
jgi:uncharacterized protein